jgi:hypothetical protein
MNEKNVYKKIISNEDISEQTIKKFKKKIQASIRKKFSCYLAGKSLSVEGKNARFKGILFIFFADKKIMRKFMKQCTLRLGTQAWKLSDDDVLLSSHRLGLKIVRINMSFDIFRLAEEGIHHPIQLKYKFAKGIKVKRKIRYSYFTSLFPSRTNNSKKALQYDEKGCLFLRQSGSNNVFVTARDYKHTDSTYENFRINTAWFISKVVSLFWRPVVMYEKLSSSFEESASVVFDEMHRRNTGAYFILEENHKNFGELSARYGSKLVKKYSFLHYLIFFCSRTFISTETISHSIELRIANTHALRKMLSKKITMVFLQHGISYMISFSSGYRARFKRNGGMLSENSKIVVSSAKEAEHFIIEAGYTPDMLYLSGLPKFDEATRSAAADKIVIMPTWRPWEFNIVRTDPEETGYYKMMLEMFSSVPKKLRDKVIILPHPLFKGSMKGTKLDQYTNDSLSHNDILKQTEVLLTDYSSISYDAFYRGANVIFWWKDLDECMEKYKGELKLNQQNAFGDIAINKDQLTRSIDKNYGRKQKKKYVDLYREIVEFHDNKNTERLLLKLYADKII